MSLEQVKVRVTDLALGMFVSQLDCPWSHTPFPLQGFLLRNSSDISTLRIYCDYVFIDITKGRGPLKEGQPKEALVPFSGTKPDVARAAHNIDKPLSNRSEGTKPSPIVVKRYVYSDVVPLNLEINLAKRAMKTLRGHLIIASKQIAKGKEFDYPALRSSVDQMVDSVVRCPDAFTWLMRLRAKDQFSHDHAMRSALWSTQFGRFIGLPKEELATLTLGALLKDIGKVQIPVNILKAKKRTAEQKKEYYKFVEHSVTMLKSSNVDAGVVSVVRHHCERNDGTGYPRGLVGNKIPLLARIVGIATYYDQISTPRGSNSLSPSKAISALYNMRGKGFQDDLTVQFIQSIGLYPTGTLAELTTGDIGVVVEQHPTSRLTPQIALVSAPSGVSASRHTDYLLVDLKDEFKARRKMLDHGYTRAKGVSKLAVARDLAFSGYDVDMEAVSNLFMTNDNADEQFATKRSSGLLAKVKNLFAPRLD